MRRLDPAGFSARYAVRALTEADVPAIYTLCRSNPLYYAHCGMEPSGELIARDMALLPPGTDAEQKYYLGFFDGGCLLAVLDLIDAYPEDGTAFIGFFMLDGEHSGRGLGSSVIGELLAALREAGIQSVRLAYVKSNPQATRFWTKNGFCPLRKVSHPDYGTVIVAERALRSEQRL